MAPNLQINSNDEAKIRFTFFCLCFLTSIITAQVVDLQTTKKDQMIHGGITQFPHHTIILDHSLIRGEKLVIKSSVKTIVLKGSNKLCFKIVEIEDPSQIIEIQSEKDKTPGGMILSYKKWKNKKITTFKILDEGVLSSLEFKKERICSEE